LPAGLGINNRSGINPLEFCQDLGIYKNQMIFQGQIAVGVEKSIAGMIMLAVKLLQRLIG
jgi:hypothetical protein